MSCMRLVVAVALEVGGRAPRNGAATVDRVRCSPRAVLIPWGRRGMLCGEDDQRLCGRSNMVGDGYTGSESVTE